MAKQKAGATNNPASRGRRDLISKLLDGLEEKLGAAAEKVSVADLIRLMQLERELEQDEPPREIKVTWIPRRESDTEESSIAPFRPN